MDNEVVNVSDLKPNEWNANKMTDETFEHLTNTIDDYGFLQNILVWRNSNKELIIIDGFHRMMSLRKLGVETVEAKVLSNEDLFKIGMKLKDDNKIKFVAGDDKEEMLTNVAKTLTILMNEIKGEADVVRMAELIESLKPSFDIEQLSKVLNISEEDIASYKSILDADAKDIDNIMSIKDKKPLNEVRLIYDEVSHNIFNKAVEHTGIGNISDAVLEICKDYLSQRGIEYNNNLELK